MVYAAELIQTMSFVLFLCEYVNADLKKKDKYNKLHCRWEYGWVT